METILSAGVRNAAITVCADAKQNITLLYKGKSLPYNVFHTCTGVRRKCKPIKQSEVVIAKDLNKSIKTKSAPVPHKPASDHPWPTFPLSKKSRNVPAARGGNISALEIS